MNLAETLAVKQLSDHVFTATPPGSGLLFGGCSLGLALNAAAKTVPPDMTPKSLHACFLRPGASGFESILTVEPWSDGRSFATRQVTLNQDDRTIVAVVATFHVPGDSGDWQVPAPPLPEPNQLRPARVFLPETIIEIRSLNGGTGEPLHQSLHPYWAKSIGPMGDDRGLHCSALAFMSDYMVVFSMYQAGPVIPETATIRTVTHSLWFHREVNAEGWLFFESKPLSVTNGRGFAIGSVHSEGGTLLASFAQEVIVQP